MLATGVTSHAVPVRKTSVARPSSSGMTIRSTTSMPRSRARPMTVRRVMPSRKQSGTGVCRVPSPKTKKMLAPVASATRPRQSSIRASSNPSRSAACLDRVQIM